MHSYPLPPFCSVADFATAQASAVNAKKALSSSAFVIQPTPLTLSASIVAPTNTVLAAVLVTPKGTGVYSVSFSLVFALAAAATVTADVLGVGAVTGVSGGVQYLPGFRYLSGSPVVLAGAQTPTTTGPVAGSAVPAASIAAWTLTMSGYVLVPPGAQGAIVVAVTSTGTLQAATLAGGFFELP